MEDEIKRVLKKMAEDVTLSLKVEVDSNREGNCISVSLMLDKEELLSDTVDGIIFV